MKLADRRSSIEAERLYRDAERYMVGGVSAAVRVHASLGRPLILARAAGSRIFDVDGNAYVDINMSFGATLLGHGHPAVREAIERALDLGIMCTYETKYQAEVARKITEMIPSAELVRFTGSGTEATYYAIRTARAFTGRQKVVKFEGHFHGYHDYLAYSAWPPLDLAGPEDAPAPYAETAGIPAAVRQNVIVLPWNDVEVLERGLRSYGDEIAAVIMEPVNHNAGTILPVPGYLEAARRLTRDSGTVLIFDEILSGFRTGASGAQGKFGVTPDLCTLGKALGGGTPLSVLTGRLDIMESLSPKGPAVQSGTFNAHLVPILAANAFLDQIAVPDFYPRLDAANERLYTGLVEIFERVHLPVLVQAAGARFSLLFGLEEQPTNYRQAARYDRALANRFFAAALGRGVYFHSGWHHGISAAHSDADIDQVLETAESAARQVAGG